MKVFSTETKKEQKNRENTKPLFTKHEVETFTAINNLLYINPSYLTDKAKKYRLELLGRINTLKKSKRRI